MSTADIADASGAKRLEKSMTCGERGETASLSIRESLG
jgi:hypothetical protein